MSRLTYKSKGSSDSKSIKKDLIIHYRCRRAYMRKLSGTYAIKILLGISENDKDAINWFVGKRLHPEVDPDTRTIKLTKLPDGDKGGYGIHHQAGKSNRKGEDQLIINMTGDEDPLFIHTPPYRMYYVRHEWDGQTLIVHLPDENSPLVVNHSRENPYKITKKKVAIDEPLIQKVAGKEKVIADKPDRKSKLFKHEDVLTGKEEIVIEPPLGAGKVKSIKSHPLDIDVEAVDYAHFEVPREVAAKFIKYCYNHKHDANDIVTTLVRNFLSLYGNSKAD